MYFRVNIICLGNTINVFLKLPGCSVIVYILCLVYDWIMEYILLQTICLQLQLDLFSCWKPYYEVAFSCRPFWPAENCLHIPPETTKTKDPVISSVIHREVYFILMMLTQEESFLIEHWETRVAVYSLVLNTKHLSDSWFVYFSCHGVRVCSLFMYTAVTILVQVSEIILGLLWYISH